MRQASITITDDGDVCNIGYVVEYKLSTDVEYTQLYPNPLASPIVIQNLEDDVVYNVRIGRLCCNGDTSDWSTVDVDTTIV